MNTLQHLLYDGSPFARPCDGARNVQTAPIPVVPGTDAALSIAFISPATFRRIPVDEIASGVAAWRFCVADGLDRTKPLLFATDAVTQDLSADTLEIGLAGSWTEQMRAAIGDRPKAVFMAELAGYGSAEDAGTATAPVFSVAFPFCAANRRDDGTGTQPLRDLSIEAHDADATAHPSIRNALAYKADLVGGKVPSSQLPSYEDDVLEYDSLSAFPATGEAGKIYVAKDTNRTYRWTGTRYAPVGGGEAPIPYDSSPAMDGAASAGSSAAYARGDHVHPTDTTRASSADATLTPIYEGGRTEPFSEWSFDKPATVVIGDFQFNASSGKWVIEFGDQRDPFTYTGEVSGTLNDTEVVFDYSEGIGVVITATRTAYALTSYRLGNDAAHGGLNADKPIPAPAAIPAVVAPSTAAADAGKAADAKATGDQLAGKLDKAGGAMTGNLTISGARLRLSDANGNVGAQFADDGAMFGNEVFGYPHSRFANRLAAFDDIPASETWTFEVDDGQGGTTTVTKSVAVFAAAQNAQAAPGGTP